MQIRTQLATAKHGDFIIYHRMVGKNIDREIKPQARVLASDRGIECVVLDYDALRGYDDKDTRLF